MSLYKEIISELLINKRVVVTGVKKGLSERIAVEIANRGGLKVVYVCSDEDSLDRSWKNLYHYDAIFGGGKVTPEEVRRPETCRRVIFFPHHIHSPYQDVTGDFYYEMGRQSALSFIASNSKWKYLVISTDSLILKVPPPPVVLSRILNIECGQEIEPQEIDRKLIFNGYYKTQVVESPGTFARRGGILDIFPPSSFLPVRIEWYGPYIEKIRHFDPESQRTKYEVPSIEIVPVRAILRDEDTINVAIEKIKKLFLKQDIPAQKRQEYLSFFETSKWQSAIWIRRFIPAFYESLVSLNDYLGGFPVVFVLAEPDIIKKGIEIGWEKILRDFYSLRKNDEPAFEPEILCASCDEVIASLEKSCWVKMYPASSIIFSVEGENQIKTVEAGGGYLTEKFGLGKNIDGIKAGAISFRGLAGKVKEYLNANFSVTMTTLSSSGQKRFEEILGKYGIKFATSERGHARISIGPALNGFFLESERELLITEEEIFGKKIRSKKIAGSCSLRIDSLQSLIPGEYVVHEIHGVGIYEGQVFMEFDSNKVELMKITYRGGDILYVPVYHLNQVQKFMGGKPRILDKLGGETFLRAKIKSKKSAHEIAEKLLQLYASRKTVTRQPYPFDGDAYFEFESLFPYEETDDQIKAVKEIMDDLDKTEPMDRLLCGDVGFGKTEVAIRAAWRVVMSGKQVAVMVPTTVLAQQHYVTFKSRFSDIPVNIEVLSRFQSPSKQSEIVRFLREGKVDIVIGTHRLLSSDVHFSNLGLLIIDEEQRFGVTQKERIKFLRPDVDVLTMTATPIPRTMQMSLASMLSLSILGTPPAHRLPIKTYIINWNEEVIANAIRREIERGGQVFFLHNRIETIGKILEEVRKMVPEAKVESAWGTMKSSMLEKIMFDFVSRKIDVLVCTSIIESGIDIPNANTIFIDEVHRFGLADLYQIRGRIGRSSQQAYAYLILPRRGRMTPEAGQRIDTIAKMTELGSGFGVAVMDLELRGAGELLGEKQSGNVRRVGFEMYYRMIEEAIAGIKGEPFSPEIEPEIKIAITAFIPEDYLPDPGLRLAFYKRLAGATSEQEVLSIIEEMEDRFGAIPSEVSNLREIMVLKTILRKLNAYGIEANSKKVQVYLSPKTPIPAEKIVCFIEEASKSESIRLTPDMKVVYYAGDEGDPVFLSRDLLERLLKLVQMDGSKKVSSMVSDFKES